MAFWYVISLHNLQFTEGKKKSKVSLRLRLVIPLRGLLNEAFVCIPQIFNVHGFLHTESYHCVWAS
jgi:hypothetical protein